MSYDTRKSERVNYKELHETGRSSYTEQTKKTEGEIDIGEDSLKEETGATGDYNTGDMFNEETNDRSDEEDEELEEKSGKYRWRRHEFKKE